MLQASRSARTWLPLTPLKSYGSRKEYFGLPASFLALIKSQWRQSYVVEAAKNNKNIWWLSVTLSQRSRLTSGIFCRETHSDSNQLQLGENKNTLWTDGMSVSQHTWWAGDSDRRLELAGDSNWAVLLTDQTKPDPTRADKTRITSGRSQQRCLCQCNSRRSADWTQVRCFSLSSVVSSASSPYLTRCSLKLQNLQLFFYYSKQYWAQ